MFVWRNVRWCPVTKCPCDEKSGDEMSYDEISVWRNVCVTNCPVTKCLCDEMSCDNMSVWRIVLWRNVLWRNVHVTKCRWRNVLWRNVLWRYDRRPLCVVRLLVFYFSWHPWWHVIFCLDTHTLLIQDRHVRMTSKWTDQPEPDLSLPPFLEMLCLILYVS